MTYRIEGLAPAAFESLFSMTEGELAARNAVRVTAKSARGYPCRVTLEDAGEGESLILLHHVSHDVATPYRSAYAIYVRESATEAASYTDELPPVFEGRPLGPRAFDAEGMLRDALLALPGEADAKIRALFERPEIATIHAHNAAHGCFAARIERN
ncbi:DUF1203 domain-containing protein [Sphingosinicella sp. LHD-64]|uniref:DUF1203 domain-containing protein n=1 Tax=Sphingosinicella sp. LHD-64 TaxID=3072139 RepID=UPI00280CD1E2|nr:DUF1203 domain-containing protein [Sphingosinicella sp. LHD-64]MDQ8757290.1 DUF1203 domain-containing protein [Sphingosinicella sp. LHD-64]